MTAVRRSLNLLGRRARRIEKFRRVEGHVGYLVVLESIVEDGFHGSR